MASFRQTMKHCLLSYPTIFPNPLNVCVHLFCVIGNGYQWHKGQLVDRYEGAKIPKRMKYPKEDFSKDWSQKSIRQSGIKIQNEARLHQMRFIEKNIDAIVAADPVNVYFGSSRQGCFVTDNICLEYADGLQFPDDIKKDWAQALYRFLDWWIDQLFEVYGTTPEGWPEQIQQAHKEIVKARNRLHTIIHNETYAEYAVRISEHIKGVISSLKEPNQ